MPVGLLKSDPGGFKNVGRWRGMKLSLIHLSGGECTVGGKSAMSVLRPRAWQQDFTTAADNDQDHILLQIYIYKMLVSNTVLCRTLVRIRYFLS